MIQRHGGVGQTEVCAGGSGGIVHGGVDMGPFSVQPDDIPGGVFCAVYNDAFHAGGGEQLFQGPGITEAAGAALDQGGVGAVGASGRCVGDQSGVEPEGTVIVACAAGFAHGGKPEGDGFGKLGIPKGGQLLFTQLRFGRGLGGRFDGGLGRRLGGGFRRGFGRGLNGRFCRRSESGLRSGISLRLLRGVFNRSLSELFGRSLSGLLCGNLRRFSGRRFRGSLYGGFGWIGRGCGLRRQDFSDHKIRHIPFGRHGNTGHHEHQAQQGAQTAHKFFLHLFKPPKWHTSP